MRSPAASASDAVQTAPDIHSESALKHRAELLWPEAVVVLGLGLSAAWIILLGYGVVTLVRLVV